MSPWVRLLARVGVLVLAAGPSVLLAHSAGAASEPPVQAAAKVFVLDRKAKLIRVLDPANWATLGTIDLGAKPGPTPGWAWPPEAMLATPDGTRLVVVYLTPGKIHHRGTLDVQFRFQPTFKTVVSIVDVALLKVISRTELGWGWGDATVSRRGWGPLKLDYGTHTAFVSPDSRRLTVLFPGYRSDKPGESLPGEVVTLDLGTGQLAGRLPQECSVDEKGRAAEEGPQDSASYLLLGNGDRLVGLCPRRLGKQGPALAAELRIIDLKGPTQVATVPLPDTPVAVVSSPGGKRLYVLTLDRPDPKEQRKTNPTRFHAVDTESGQLETSIEVAPAYSSEFQIAPDGGRLFALGAHAVSTLRLPDLKVTGAVQLEGEQPVSDLMVSSDGSRGYVSFAQSGRFAVIDLDDPKVVATGEVPGLGKGAKFGQGALTGGLVGGLLGLLSSDLPPAGTRFALSPDEKWLFVSNTESGETFIADSASGTVHDRLESSGFVHLAGGRSLLLLKGASVAFRDLPSRDEAKPKWIPLGNQLEDLWISPDETLAVAVTDREGFNQTARWVVIVDLTRRQIVTTLKDFKDPSQVLFSGAARRPPTWMRYGLAFVPR